MGEAAKVDRVYIWKNHTINGELYSSQVYEWSGGAEPQQGKELLQNVSYKDGMRHWEETLLRGDCVSKLASEFPSDTKEILAAQNILSILVVPIFLREQFWGFVGFDDCHTGRVFSSSEEKILRPASELIANALIRYDMEKTIQHLEMEVDKIYYDPLSGIYNRRYFNENMERLIHTLSRNGGSLSLMMVDIDFFKKYNDSYGSLKGDECLKSIAETLQKSITGKEDFAARYGGDEFVVVLPKTNENGARMIAEHMIEHVRNAHIPHEENSEKRVTISIGVTTGDPKDTFTTKAFIQRAEALLYEAKRNGYNRYMFTSL